MCVFKLHSITYHVVSVLAGTAGSRKFSSQKYTHIKHKSIKPQAAHCFPDIQGEGLESPRHGYRLPSEAKKRGLPNNNTTPLAVQQFNTDRTHNKH